MTLVAKLTIEENECGPLTHYSGKDYVASYDTLNDRVKAYVNECVKDIILKHGDILTCVSLWIPHSLYLTQSGYFSGKAICVSLEKPLLENIKALLAEKNVNRLFCVFQNGGINPKGWAPRVLDNSVPSVGDAGWTVAFVQHGTVRARGSIDAGEKN